MLTRNEIDETINGLQKLLNEQLPTLKDPKDKVVAGLVGIGLELLGNFLGDISDIALNNRRQHEDCLAYKAKMGLDEVLR